MTGDGKLTNSASFIPDSCGNFAFFVGIWNKNPYEQVTELPANIVAKFPLTDDLTLFKVVDIKGVGLAPGEYAFDDISKILTINALSSDISDHPIPVFSNLTPAASFLGVQVIVNNCK